MLLLLLHLNIDLKPQQCSEGTVSCRVRARVRPAETGQTASYTLRMCTLVYNTSPPRWRQIFGNIMGKSVRSTWPRTCVRVSVNHLDKMTTPRTALLHTTLHSSVGKHTHTQLVHNFPKPTGSVLWVTGPHTPCCLYAARCHK